MIIGLDLATKSGVAFGCAGSAPETYQIVFEGSHEARLLDCFVNMRRLFKSNQPEFVGIELPIMGGKANLRATMLKTGLVNAARMAAYSLEIPHEMFATQTLDRHFLGHVPKGRQNRKNAIMRQCELLGWQAGTQDEFDAMQVWDYAAAWHNRKHAIASLPLFSASKKSSKHIRAVSRKPRFGTRFIKGG